MSPTSLDIEVAAGKATPASTVEAERGITCKPKYVAVAVGIATLLLLVTVSVVFVVVVPNMGVSPGVTDQTVDVNATLARFKHPELLLPNTTEPNEFEASPEAWGMHGTNTCNYWNKANPAAVKTAEAFKSVGLNWVQQVVDTCSSHCDLLDYSVPAGLLGPLPVGPSPRTQWVERHPGWGGFVCGTGQHMQYGVYRGGKACAERCCYRQLDYCGRNCLTSGSDCKRKCMFERGCKFSNSQRWPHDGLELSNPTGNPVAAPAGYKCKPDRKLTGDENGCPADMSSLRV